MEFLQERCNMAMTFLTEGQSGSVVLYFLQSGYLFRGNASQEGIAVKQSILEVMREPASSAAA